MDWAVGTTGKIVAVSTSKTKSVRKNNVDEAYVKANWGIEGDAHAGDWHRQVSLLAIESIRKMQEKGLKVKEGDFAENLTTTGIDLPMLPLGTQVAIGDEILLEVTQIGKECHTKCAIYYQAGDCVMPREGIFVKVLRGGTVRPGDTITVKSIPEGAVPTPPVGTTGGPVTLQTPPKPKALFRVAVVTASDKGSRGERIDESGQVIKRMIATVGGEVVFYRIVPDELTVLTDLLREVCDGGEVDLVLTTGGTGLGPRDVTPDATLAVAERIVPGIPEAMRMKSLEITSRAMLSRAVAATRKKTLIINLPGSPKGVSECLEVVLPALAHGLAILAGTTGECAR